jgi:Ser/Thr protein kinase RdoA (MazF antagonist)
LTEHLPTKDHIEKTLRQNWDFDVALTPVSGTSRLFWFIQNNTKRFARLNWPRGKLTAGGIVNFVDHVFKTGAPVPQIVPTRSGELCIRLKNQTVLSVETDLGGQPCDATNVHRLRSVGQGLAKIHAGSASFRQSEPEKADLTDFVQVKLRRALSRTLPVDLHNALRKLDTELQTTYRDLSRTQVTWLTTHGDVWGPNVHTDGHAVSFTDIYCTHAPATVDLAMAQHRWLMNDKVERRSLRSEEMTELLAGYQSERPLTQEDRETFGVVWAAYYADKLSYYVEKPGRVKGLEDSQLDYAQVIRQLPYDVGEVRSYI